MRASIWFLFVVVVCVTGRRPSAQSLAPTNVHEEVVVPAPGIGARNGFRGFHFPCKPHNFPPGHHQYLFRVPNVVPEVVRSIAFRRRDQPWTPKTTLPAFDVEIELWMGHSPRTPASYGYILSSNRGPDYTQVLGKTTIHFAAEPYRQDNDYPFSYRLPLDTGFSFVPGQVGFVELRIHHSGLCWPQVPGNAAFEWEAYNVRESYPWTSVQTIGKWCGAGGNSLTATAISVGNPGFAFMAPQTVAGNGASVAIYGGLSNSLWAGLQLPFSLTPWGAAGCTIYSSLEWVWPPMWASRPSGPMGVAIDLPNDPSLVGKTVYAQGVRLDPLANPLGVVTSNGLRFVIGPHLDPEISTLKTPFGGFPSPASGGGQRVLGHGPVMKLSSR